MKFVSGNISRSNSIITGAAPEPVPPAVDDMTKQYFLLDISFCNLVSPSMLPISLHKYSFIFALFLPEPSISALSPILNLRLSSVLTIARSASDELMYTQSNISGYLISHLFATWPPALPRPTSTISLFIRNPSFEYNLLIGVKSI